MTTPDTVSTEAENAKNVASGNNSENKSATKNSYSSSGETEESVEMSAGQNSDSNKVKKSSNKDTPLVRKKRKGGGGPPRKGEKDSPDEAKSVDFDSDARFVKRMMDILPKYR